MIAIKSWKALGTSVHVLSTDSEQLPEAESVVRQVLADVDATYSRFRDDSELSRVNARAGETVRVSELLGRAIGVALAAARRTNGAVDPTVGEAIRLAGYDADFASVPRNGAAVALRAVRIAGWEVVRFDARTRTLSMPAGVELDLGSTGKAFAADLAADAAHRATGAGVLVSFGGDIATAGDAPEGGWRVLIAEDSNDSPQGEGQVVAIQRGGIATSSTTVRRWSRGDRMLHHIIDPHTGLPSSGPWRTVTALAGNCVDANTAATAAIVMGDRAIDWMKASRIPARLVEADGTVHFLGPWPDPRRVAA